MAEPQLSNAISAQILPINPQDQHQPIHRVLVNGSSMIVRFCEIKLGQILQLKVGCPNFGPVRDYYTHT